MRYVIGDATASQDGRSLFRRMSSVSDLVGNTIRLLARTCRGGWERVQSYRFFSRESTSLSRLRS